MKVREKMIASNLKMTAAMTELKKAELLQHDWFVAYENPDTRNALAQGLKLVDHEGDEIFYSGNSLPGFKVTFTQMLFLVKGRHSGVYKFTAYHRAKGASKWERWMENTKSALQIIKGHTITTGASNAE